MAFNTIETSAQDSKPISLYEFRLEDFYFRYTSADRDIVYGGNTFTRVTMQDGGSSQGGGDGNSELLAISIDASADICALFEGVAPSAKLRVKKYRLHDGDTEAVINWVGFVGSCSWKDDATKTLNCTSILGTLQASGLRLCWERNCPHMLYGEGCNLNKEDFGFDAEALNPTGDSITILIPASPLPVAGLGGGFISWELGSGVTETRAILKQVYPTTILPGADTQVTLLGGAAGIAPNQAIRVYPGCDRTTDNNGCSAFDNTDNFGGYNAQPGVSPFDGNPVF